MAYAIMGGSAVATLLTLVFLPALYVTWFQIKRPLPGEDERLARVRLAQASEDVGAPGEGLQADQ